MLARSFAVISFQFLLGPEKDGATKNKMSEFTHKSLPIDIASSRANPKESEPSFGLRYSTRAELKGLIVSSDDEVCRSLAEMLRQHGIASVFASSVSESGMRLTGSKVQIVVCQDRLADGNYDGVVKMADKSKVGAPVIVFSRTGDWPEYLAAVRAGAFDYLAYPPMPGEFERIVQNAVRECERGCRFKENV